MSKIALLWDRSNIWGLMAMDSFLSHGLDFALITGEQVKEGRLEECKILFVPGGWSVEKKESLGDDGARAVRKFVEDGGAYAGVCGGAGLGLDEDTGLGLLPVSRGRGLPNFSGPISMKVQSASLAGKVDATITAPAWWPGHFQPPSGSQVDIVAVYGAPGPGFMVADLYVEDMLLSGGFRSWEEAYGIELDPSSLAGSPAIVKGKMGAGTVLLSYPHLETPGFPESNLALTSLLEEDCADSILAGRKLNPVQDGAGAHGDYSVRRLVEDFNTFGERNFLWAGRSGNLTQWRRGIRGIEYQTLMHLAGRLEAWSPTSLPGEYIKEVEEYFRESKKLLMAERLYMSQGILPLFKCPDAQIQAMRAELFGEERRPGGAYIALVEKTCSLLYSAASGLWL